MWRALREQQLDDSAAAGLSGRFGFWLILSLVDCPVTVLILQGWAVTNCMAFCAG